MTCLGLAIIEHLIQLKNSPTTYLIIMVGINNFQEVLFYPSFSCFSENSLMVMFIQRSILFLFLVEKLWRKYIQQGLPVGQFRMLSRSDLGSQAGKEYAIL